MAVTVNKPRAARRDHSRLRSLLALVVFCVAAIVVFGLPAVSRPSTVVLGEGPDVQIFVWALRWWPYAIGHGLDPFTTRLLWPPHGVSTLWTTTVPALALLAAPLTLTAGPIVAWNALVVLAPATAGWATYLLTRELTVGHAWAMLAGGLFGFSAYEQCQSLAHLQLTACIAVPLLLRVIVRFDSGRVSRKRAAAQFAMLVAFQSLISVEVLTSMLLIAALTACARWVLCPTQRTRTMSVVILVALGLLISLPITGTVAVLMLRTAPTHVLNPVQDYSLDLLNSALPTSHTLIGGHAATPITRTFTGNAAEQDGYIGPPLIAITLIGVWSSRDSTVERTATAALAIAFVLSLGPRLHIAGHSLVPLPDALLQHLRVFGDLVPDRLALYTALACAIIAARQLQRVHLHPALGGGCAAVLLAGTLSTAASQSAEPQTIATHLAQARGTAISLPFWSLRDRAIELQAQAGLRFALIDRWIQDTPNSDRPLARQPPLYGRTGGASHRPLRDIFCHHNIHMVIIWPGASSSVIARELHVARPTKQQPRIERITCPAD